jgi:hypothetical protein
MVWCLVKHKDNFTFTASRTALEPTHPPIQWVRGAISLGVKRPGREADQSPPSSAEVKNAWSYTSTPPIRLHGVLLRKKKSTGTNLLQPILQWRLSIPLAVNVYFSTSFFVVLYSQRSVTDRSTSLWTGSGEINITSSPTRFCSTTPCMVPLPLRGGDIVSPMQANSGGHRPAQDSMPWPQGRLYQPKCIQCQKLFPPPPEVLTEYSDWSKFLSAATRKGLKFMARFNVLYSCLPEGNSRRKMFIRHQDINPGWCVSAPL